MDTNYNNITNFQLIPYIRPPTSLPSLDTNSIIEDYVPKNDNTTNISTGGNDPTQTKSQKLSQLSSTSSKQASSIPYTDGPLIQNLFIINSISNSIQIKFNYYSSSFTIFTVVATPIASILSGPLAIITQNIPISDTTGCTDITKNQHIYTITGLSQGTQYSILLSATSNVFKRTTTIVYPNFATKQPPDPPTNLKIASLTDYAADIMFTPPIQIIDTYVANVYSGIRFMFSERFVVPKGTVVQLPLTVSGLNFHVNYTITLFAINSDGLSQGSVPITFLTPQIPDAPTNLFSPSQTSNSIDISFNPPLQYVQYYTLVAIDASNTQIFNTNINSPSNKYSVTGLLPNQKYTINIYSINADGISPTYTVLVAETLPTLTSVSFGQITSTSIQFTNLLGIYDKIYVQRNIGSLIDGSFNISSDTTTYNDMNLTPNTQYTYVLSPVNSFGFVNSPYNSPNYLSKFTYASGLIGGCTNISSFYMQINFTGYYNYATIQRNIGMFVSGDTSNFPISSSPQKNVDAFAIDTGLSANTPYTYTVTIYNGDNVPNVLSINVGATTLCVVYNASFGTITNNSIKISDISGVYSKLTILRTGGIQGYTSYDIYNTTDTSYNDTNLSPNTLYTYILIPYALNTDYSRPQIIRYYLPGVQYNSLINGTYTRPTLTDASFSNTTYNSISLYKITGIFDRVRIVRTTNGFGPTATYDICSNVVSFTDISGLSPNSLNTYTLTSYNPNNLTGDIINLSIYTDASGYILPCIATGVDKLYIQWTGYDSSVSVIRSGGGQFTPISSVNYPTSSTPQNFVGGNVTDSGLISNLPYTYNVTLYNGNAKPTVISTTIGNTTLPQITSATFGTITPTSQLIQGISGNYTTIVINQTNITNSVTTNGVATISGNNTVISGLTPNNNYTYSLIPFNGLGVSGATFNMSSLYTLPTLTTVSFGSFTKTSLALQNMVGSYDHIYIDRYTTNIVTPSYNIITVNSPVNSAVDVSLNPNTQYTYYLTPYNPNNTAGATYITSGKYTDISAIFLSPSNITSTSLQLNLYGVYSKVAISRNISGGNFPINYFSSTPQTINTAYVTDISVNTNAFYTYTFHFTNGDGLTNISDISQTILTLPTITSVQYTDHNYNSLKVQLSGLYYQYVKVYRIDISNNINTFVNTIYSPDFSYNDTGLSPNYRYQYRCVPYNINDISGISVTSSPKYTDASGQTLSFNNITFSSAQVNWMGYYTSISITRYIDTVQSDFKYITWSNTTQYSNIPDPAAQTLLTGYLRDLSIIQNITYTYRFLLYNGDGLSVSLPDIFFTNLPVITSIPTFGMVTSTSINITNVAAICSNIRVYRYDAANNNTVSFDVSNTTNIYDNSVNFTAQTIPYDASYTYKLTPFGVTGISGDTVAVPGVIYTLPILYNVSYGVIDVSSIQFNLITGSYEYIQVDRYYGDSTLQQRNAFNIIKGQSIYNDVGLLTDVSYSYRFTPFNLSIPNISGGAITLPTIYTKPSLPSAIYKTPTYTSIPIDISSSICTSITINRIDPNTINTKSYDVSYAPTIYDVSTNFINSIIPYDVSYTYTLMPKNHVGISGTIYSGLGTIYTLPYLVSASFGTVTTDKIGIIVNASCTSITINRTDASYGINTTSYDVSYAPIIYDTSINFSGSIIPSSSIYNYVLTPKNHVGIVGASYIILSKLYTLPAITNATYGTITSTIIPINVQGTGTYITVKRIDPNTTNTKSYDVSYANIIYDFSGNFNNNNNIIPYDVSYTYTLTPFNAIGISGTTYTVGTIYTIPAITSAQYKTPTYQTIPIDISSSIGLCTNITVSRYKGNSIDTYGSNNNVAIFDVSYASTINDVSTNFTNQIIPYNTAYTYKLSPKNHNGVYGADISLSTIYTLPVIVSAAYKTPTTQTIPIDISSSFGLSTNITVKRYRGGVIDVSRAVFDVSNASTIYDVSGNFSGNVIPYDISYTYSLTPLNVVGVSGTVYNIPGTIYTLPTLKSASYGVITNNSISITNIDGSYQYMNITRNLLSFNNIVTSSVPNALNNISASTIIITDNSGIQGLNPNTNYSYTLYAYNGSGQNSVYTMSGIYTLTQGSVGTITSSLTSIVLTWSGIYSSVTISRSDNSGIFTGISNYPLSNFPQNTINGSAYDTNISAGASYIYTIYLLNSSNVATSIGSLTSTPTAAISNATYTTITSTSIYLTGFTGSYSKIILTRNKGQGYGVFDASYMINYPDNSHNDIGLLPNTSYSYSLLPFNTVNSVDVSGSYYKITPLNIYTLPTITNVLYSASANSINFTTIDGSYSYFSINRYRNSIIETSNNIFGTTLYSDTGLLPDTSYSYQIIPWGSGSSALSGAIYYSPSISGVIYTLPGITSATFGTPTATQIPINVVAGCTSITISRSDPVGTNTKSYDVSNAAIIYDNSVNFTNSTIPYDVSYTYTLTPKNNAGVAGSSLSVGTVYTIPNIATATSTVIDFSSIQISVTGSYSNIQVNRYNGNTLFNTQTYAKAQFPIIDTNLLTDISYNYTLIPYNEGFPSLSGGTVTIPAKYTYGNITDASLLNINSSTLSIIGINGTYDGIYYTRTGGGSTINSTISTSVTSYTDPSMLIPDTSYTYVLAAINKSGYANTNSNATKNLTTYTDASGYITSITNITYNSITVNWAGYCNSGFLMYSYNNAVSTTNYFSPVDGQLRTGYAIDMSGGGVGLTPNNFYSYLIYFINNNGRAIYSPAVSTFTLAYYSDASVNAIDCSSLQYSWRGYYSDISNVYQNGLLITPDTSNNTRPSAPSTVNTGSITKTGLIPNNQYYYDVSLVNTAGVATTISRQIGNTDPSGISYACTNVSSGTATINWSGYYSSVSILRTTISGNTSGNTLSLTGGNNYITNNNSGNLVIGNVIDTTVGSLNQCYYNIILTGRNPARSIILAQQSAIFALPTFVFYGASAYTSNSTYTIIAFTNAGTTITNAISFIGMSNMNIYVFAVGGGGAGSGGSGEQGGGGGAGGVVQSTLSISGSDSVTINVGTGGLGATSTSTINSNSDGQNTTVTFVTETSNNILAYGGERGFGYHSTPGYATKYGSGGGQSGGGLGPTTGGVTIVAGQGNLGGNATGQTGQNGLNGGGGGGAGAVGGTATGTSGGNGGIGVQPTLPYISTSSYGSYYWAGGGGGSGYTWSSGLGGNGGSGGGGGGSAPQGGTYTPTTSVSSGGSSIFGDASGGYYGAQAGNAGRNSGGGGGASSTSYISGNGGSGIVLVAVPTNNINISSFTGQTAYYPLVSDIKNYNSGSGIIDASMGVAGNTGGTPIFDTTSYVVNSMIGAGSLIFVGSSTHNYVNAPYVKLPLLTCTNSIISFTCWFKSNNNSQYAQLFDFGSRFRLSIYGLFSMSFNDTTIINPNADINAGIWTFIAITVSGTTFNWYINAGDTGNSGSNTLTTVNNVNLTSAVGYLGHSDTAGYPEFSGAMQDVRFFNGTALTASQISNIYAYGVSRVGTSIFTPVLGVSTITFSNYNTQYCNVCCSTNGNYVYVMQKDSIYNIFYLYSSSNGGISFILASFTNAYWYSQLVCDSTGQYVWFTGNNGAPVYYSYNYGVTFAVIASNCSPSCGIAISRDGTKVTLAGASVVSYCSNGTATTPTFTAGTITTTYNGGNVSYIASSSSCQYCYFQRCDNTAYIVRSTDYGHTYADVATPAAPATSTKSVGCDTTGQYVAFVSSANNVCYLSNNYGAAGSWTLLNTTPIPSANLIELALFVSSTYIYIIMTGQNTTPFTNNLYGGYSLISGCTTPTNWTWTSLRNDLRYAGITISDTGIIYVVGESTLLVGSVNDLSAFPNRNLIYDFTAQSGIITATNGTTLTSWKDARTGKSLSGGTATYNTTTTINSYPTTTGYMNLTYGDTSTVQNYWTWFCVLRTGGTALSGNNNMIYNSSSYALEIGLNGGNLEVCYSAIAWSVAAASVSGGSSGTWIAATNTNYIFTVICSSTNNTTSSTQTYTFRINGVDYTPAVNTATGYYYINNPQIGNSSSSTQTFMGEQLLYNTNLSTSNVQSIENYLMNKWGNNFGSILLAYFNFNQDSILNNNYDIISNNLINNTYSSGTTVITYSYQSIPVSISSNAYISSPYSLYFSGGQSFVITFTIPATASGLSFSIWFYPTANNGSNNPRIFESSLGDGASVMYGSGNYNLTTGGTFTLNVWQHLVCVYNINSNSQQYYLNNTAYNGGNNPGYAKGASYNISLGDKAGGSADPFKGYFDEIQIYNIPLSSTQVTYLFNNPTSHL